MALVNFMYVNAQQTKIDSLKKLIAVTKTDTSKIILYEILILKYVQYKKIDTSKI